MLCLGFTHLENYPNILWVLFFIWYKMCQCICWKCCRNRNQEKLLWFLLMLFSRKLEEYLSVLVTVNKLNAIKKIWVLQNFKSQARLWPFSSCCLVTAFLCKNYQLKCGQIVIFRWCPRLCAAQRLTYILGKFNSTLSRLDITAALLGSKVEQTGLSLTLITHAPGVHRCVKQPT